MLRKALTERQKKHGKNSEKAAQRECQKRRKEK